jgi:hypothetical protein
MVQKKGHGHSIRSAEVVLSRSGVPISKWSHFQSKWDKLNKKDVLNMKFEHPSITGRVTVNDHVQSKDQLKRGFGIGPWSTVDPRPLSLKCDRREPRWVDEDEIGKAP